MTKDKVQISAYFIKQPNDRASSAPTLVYFHGNAGNIGQQWSSVVSSVWFYIVS